MTIRTSLLIINGVSGEEPGSDFNCFCTETAEFFGEGPKFHPATAAEPPAILGLPLLSEHDKAALIAFIESKPPRHFDDEQLYQPLLEGEIRILELYPATVDAPFEGKLHVVSTDFEYPKNPPVYRRTVPGAARTAFDQRRFNHAISLIEKTPMWYTALSYTWGAPIFDQSIKIENYLINITSGLAAAMRRLRSASQSIFLWIDQICINQSNLREKETQVPYMGVIYTNATNTLIWLGEEDGADPQLAVRALQDVHTRLQLSDATITPDDFERLQVAPADDRSWWAVRQLFRRWWFTRTWTIQEACLSRHCYMQCGTTVFSWDDIAAWCYTLEDSGLLKWLMAHDDLDAMYSNLVTTDLLMRPIGGTVINELQQTRLVDLTHQRGAEKLGTNVLLGCLVMARYAAASEPKDKVYGVLGFADVSLKPRYSKDVAYRDVYHEAFITQLMRNAPLSCVDAEEPLRPSWVPDWNTPRVTRALGYSTKAWSVYMACGEGTQKTPVALGEDKRRITFRGKIFDEIATLGAVSVSPTLYIDAANLAANEWASYATLADNPVSNAIYPAQNDSVYNAFFQTLMAGRDGTGTSALSPDHSEVFSLILDSTMGHEPSLRGQIYSIRRKKGHFTLASLVAKKGAKVRKPVQILEDMRISLNSALHMRRFAVTRKGFFALVPRGARIGDEVVVFDRYCVPFLLRRVDGKDEHGDVFELLGETYVHGIMKGEAMGMHDLPLRDVTLV